MYEFAEEVFFGYASKPEATRFISWPTHRSMEDTRSYLANSISGWKAGTEYAYIIRLKATNRLEEVLAT
jgi:ribosomal-protein-alanine N-acetyltransferase